MQKRPQSPSNIPMPIQRDGSSSNIQRSSARVARQLPQAIVPTPKKQSNSNETRIPAPLFAKSILTAADGRTVDISRYDNDNSGAYDFGNFWIVKQFFSFSLAPTLLTSGGMFPQISRLETSRPFGERLDMYFITQINKLFKQTMRKCISVPYVLHHQSLYLEESYMFSNLLCFVTSKLFTKCLLS